MDLLGDIVKDFVVRGQHDLEFLDQCLVSWQKGHVDAPEWSQHMERLNDLREMSTLMGFPELEDLLHGIQSQVETLQQQSLSPSAVAIRQLLDAVRFGRQTLSDIAARDVAARPTAATATWADRGPSFPERKSVGLAPSPVRLRAPNLPSEPIDPAHVAIEFLATSRSEEPLTPRLSTRLMHLIDEMIAARNQIRQMFAHVVSLPTAEERTRFLDQACSACPELRGSIDRLLSSEKNPERLLENPASELIRMLLDSLREDSSVEFHPPVSLPVLIVPELDASRPTEPSPAELTEDTVRLQPKVDAAGSVASDTPNEENRFPRPFGRYTLLRKLGQGGMGTVFLATDRLLNRQVALKLLRLKPTDGPEVLERFYREARVMASLQHPNLCPVFDFGEVDGQPFLTMAFIDGQPLEELLRKVGRLPLHRALTLTRTLAQALGRAHRAGVVHRDLKPANIMINDAGEPILMDFGLARRQMSGDPSITQKGVILGSPAYMAPEQVEGDIDQMGPPTDVHALGVILYEMVSGRKPFEGTVASILAQVQSKLPAPLQIDEPGGARLDAICRKAMAKSTAERFATAEEFAAELTLLLDELAQPAAVASPVPRTSLAKPSSCDPTEPGSATYVPVHASRRCWQLTAAVVALVGITIAALNFQLGRWPDPASMKVGSADKLVKSR